MIVAFILLLVVQLCAGESSCGDWVPYKDEKCFKIYDKLGLQVYDDAEKICVQPKDSDIRLITIRDKEEQAFAANLIFNTSEIVDNVWIGAKFVSEKFKWVDNTDLVYTNWAVGSPKNVSDYCAQMQSDVGSVGKWVDVSCKKKNLVVCEKSQTWSVARLQQTLLDIKRNPVPLGFIYVQLPDEKAPTEIWPWMVWSDISGKYAGVFFRVLGGNSANFGHLQTDNAPRVTQVDTISWYDIEDKSYLLQNAWQNRTLPKDGVSQWSLTGASSGDGIYARYHTSGGEVRPVNMAMRVWKRIG